MFEIFEHLPYPANISDLKPQLQSVLRQGLCCYIVARFLRPLSVGVSNLVVIFY